MRPAWLRGLVWRVDDGTLKRSSIRWSFAERRRHASLWSGTRWPPARPPPPPCSMATRTTCCRRSIPAASTCSSPARRTGATGRTNRLTTGMSSGTGWLPARPGTTCPTTPGTATTAACSGWSRYPSGTVAHLVEMFERFRPALKPAGSLWINVGDTYFARWASIRQRGRQGLGDTSRQRRRTPMGGYRQEKQLLMVPARFAVAMQNRRWILRNDLIWHKPNVPPRPETDRLRLSHEHFLPFRGPTDPRSSQVLLRPRRSRGGIERRCHVLRAPRRQRTFRNVPRASDPPAHPEHLPARRNGPRIRSAAPAGRSRCRSPPAAGPSDSTRRRPTRRPRPNSRSDANCGCWTGTDDRPTRSGELRQ